jgi:hypothetical protein
MIGRATFEPGWKWSISVKPVAKTRSCEAPHFRYQLSGTSPSQNENRANNLLRLTAPQNSALFTCLPSTRGEVLRPSPLPSRQPVRTGYPFSLVP